MYPRFGLTLMVNHACNLRCTYCYTGSKFSRRMPWAVVVRAVDRALASLDAGGTLELGFFGGEPLLEADLIAEGIAYARRQTAARCFNLCLSLTSNGTLTGPHAWAVMTDPQMELALSFDGLPETHDRHRVLEAGGGTAKEVLGTMRRLQNVGKEFRVVMVVRPDSVTALPAGLRFLQAIGVEQVELSLDLWTAWLPRDAGRLESALVEAAEIWRAGLPRFGVNWFNEVAVRLAGVPILESARCSFGQGEIAVAPSGNLYPCERLIGEDAEGNPMRLPGYILEARDFLDPPAPPPRAPAAEAAALCACGLSCRCCQFVRTGHPDKSDDLLRLLDRVCAREAARVLEATEMSAMT